MKKKILFRFIFRGVIFLLFLELFAHLGSNIFISSKEGENKQKTAAADSYRILCLGESVTFSTVKESYPALLEESLNRRASKLKFRVINKGTPGASTLTLLQSLEDNIDRYEPDMIIVMISINDVKLAEVTSYNLAGKIDFLLYERLKTYRLFKQISGRIITRLRNDKKKQSVDTESTEAKEAVSRRTTVKEQIAFQHSLKNPYDFTLNNFHRLVEAVQGRGVKLIIMQYPLTDISPLKEKIGFKKNVLFVENRTNFAQAIKESRAEDYFADFFAGDFGHCTAKGNRLIAETLAAVITRELFP